MLNALRRALRFAFAPRMCLMVSQEDDGRILLSTLREGDRSWKHRYVMRHRAPGTFEPSIFLNFNDFESFVCDQSDEIRIRAEDRANYLAARPGLIGLPHSPLLPDYTPRRWGEAP